MNLKQAKEEINKIGLMPESIEMINGVMDDAIARGYLTEEESDKISGVIDLELEADKIKIETSKEIAAALNDFSKGMDKAMNAAVLEVGAAAEEFDATLQNLAAQK